MPRLVHLAPEGRRRAIERSGIRAARSLVYAMPVLPDFSVSYQWVRELRRCHGERMIAVHFVVPSDEPVLVGRYDSPHERLPLREAIRRVLASPKGNEIILTRSVRAREVVGIRAITQLVGWTEVPEAEKAFDCLCPACVAPGTRDLSRRVRAAFERHILAARRSRTPADARAALANLGTPLERARGRIAPDKLLAFTRSKDAGVRRAAIGLLAHFRWADVEPVLARALGDDHGDVREAAVSSLVSSGGLRRAWRHVAKTEDALVTTALVDHLEFASDVDGAAAVMAEIASRASVVLGRALARAAARILREDDLGAKTKATLEALTRLE